MEINRQELLDALDTAKPGLKKDKIIEQGDYFAFTGTDIASFSNSVCIMSPFETEFTGAVPGSEFYSLVSKLPEVFDISQKGTNLIIKAEDKKGKIESELAMTTEDAAIMEMIFDVADQSDEADFIDLPEDFVDALEHCLPSAKKAESDFDIKSCIYFNGERMYATSDGRLARYIMKEKCDLDFLVQGSFIENMMKTGETFETIAITKTWIHFESTIDPGDDDNDPVKVQFSVRLWKIDDEARLDYDEPITYLEDQESEVIVFPDNIEEDIELVEVMSMGTTDASKRMSVIITKNKITLKTQKDRGTAKREIKCKNKVACEFIINPRYLVRNLKKNRKMKVYDSILSFEGENFIHLLGKVNDD